MPENDRMWKLYLLLRDVIDLVEHAGKTSYFDSLSTGDEKIGSTFAMLQYSV